MDENYLDQLLKEVESQDNILNEIEDLPEAAEDSLDDDIQLEQNLTADASSVKDVAWSDAEIPVDEISELDELDDLADLDMEDLDFEDIDFDEINTDNASVNPVQFEQELEDLMNLNIDENYLDDSEDQAFEEEFKRMKEASPSKGISDADFVDTLEEASAPSSDHENQESSVNDEFANMIEQAFSPENEADPGIKETDPGVSSDESASDSDSSDTTSGSDSEMDIDALMSEVFGDSMVDTASENGEAAGASGTDGSNENGSAPVEENKEGAGSDGQESATSAAENDPLASEMDDLFAMLGIEGDEAMKEASSMPDVSGEAPDFEIPTELEDVPDVNEKPKKRNKFLELLFGSEEEEEETLTPEQEEALAQEKEAKKKAKLEQKEAKKKEKEEKANKKKADKDNKTAELKAKKEAKKAEEERLLAEEGPEKKLNKPLVIITILFFLVIGGFVIVGTNIFDYTLVITRAQNYFDRQKYGSAYREIVGVEVKEKDKDLESRIYTVMYVERQSEAFENYVKMNRPDLGLDALLSGLEKYDVYYEEAIALNIVSDLDYAKSKILNNLQTVYGLSESDAKAILAENPYEYTQTIRSMTEDMDFEEGQAE